MSDFIINFIYHKNNENGRNDFYYSCKINENDSEEAKNKAIKMLKDKYNIDFKEINKEHKNGDYIAYISTEIDREKEFCQAIAKVNTNKNGKVELNDIYTFLAEEETEDKELRAYAKAVVKSRNRKEDK